MGGGIKLSNNCYWMERTGATQNYVIQVGKSGTNSFLVSFPSNTAIKKLCWLLKCNIHEGGNGTATSVYDAVWSCAPLVFEKDKTTKTIIKSPSGITNIEFTTSMTQPNLTTASLTLNVNYISGNTKPSEMYYYDFPKYGFYVTES